MLMRQTAEFRLVRVDDDWRFQERCSFCNPHGRQDSAPNLHVSDVRAASRGLALGYTRCRDCMALPSAGCCSRCVVPTSGFPGYEWAPALVWGWASRSRMPRILAGKGHRACSVPIGYFSVGTKRASLTASVVYPRSGGFDALQVERLAVTPKRVQFRDLRALATTMPLTVLCVIRAAPCLSRRVS